MNMRVNYGDLSLNHLPPARASYSPISQFSPGYVPTEGFDAPSEHMPPCSDERRIRRRRRPRRRIKASRRVKHLLRTRPERLFHPKYFNPRKMSLNDLKYIDQNYIGPMEAHLRSKLDNIMQGGSMASMENERDPVVDNILNSVMNGQKRLLQKAQSRSQELNLDRVQIAPGTEI
ncbi:MAG: hypothetical protein AAF621_07635 [Pseudomonadota bacterium]